jgi:hypothetical protein
MRKAQQQQAAARAETRFWLAVPFSQLRDVASSREFGLDEEQREEREKSTQQPWLQVR